MRRTVHVITVRIVQHQSPFFLHKVTGYGFLGLAHGVQSSEYPQVGVGIARGTHRYVFRRTAEYHALISLAQRKKPFVKPTVQFFGQSPETAMTFHHRRRFGGRVPVFYSFYIPERSENVVCRQHITVYFAEVRQERLRPTREHLERIAFFHIPDHRRIYFVKFKQQRYVFYLVGIGDSNGQIFDSEYLRQPYAAAYARREFFLYEQRSAPAGHDQAYVFRVTARRQYSVRYFTYER